MLKRCKVVIVKHGEITTAKGGYAQHVFDISTIRKIMPRIAQILQTDRAHALATVYTEFIHRDHDGAIAYGWS
jgi:nicotinamidase-related amidase